MGAAGGPGCGVLGAPPGFPKSSLHYKVHQGLRSVIIQNIVWYIGLKIENYLRISSKKFLELNVAEMANWQTAGNFKSNKTKYLHTGLSEDLEAYKEARKETRFDQALVRGQGRGQSAWRGKGNRGSKRGVVLRDGMRHASRSDGGGSGAGGHSGGKRACHRCGSESHLQNKCPQPRGNNGP